MATIPQHNQVDTSAEYGRPNYEVAYYSEKINAHAMSSFKTRHDAVGYISRGLREGWMKRPTLKYNATFDRKQYTKLGAWGNSW